MKNIEKIAIDAITLEFANKNEEIIMSCISAKSAAETAQANFKKIAQPLISLATETSSTILSDGLSEDAVAYLETKMTEILRLPFKTK